MQLAHNIDLPSLTLENILLDHNQLSSNLALANPTLYKHFLQYLQIGFYPFFIEDELEYKNKLFNACDKIINEDIPSLNKIDYAHLSIFKKFTAKLIYAKVPFKVNIAELCREFQISHPTMATYLEILNATKLIHPIKKYSKNSYLVIDTDYTMEKNKIPLWLFGLMGF